MKKKKKAFAKANVHTVDPRVRDMYLGQGPHGAGKSNMSGPGDKRSPFAKCYQVG